MFQKQPYFTYCLCYPWNHTNRFMNKHYEELQALFSLDPLLVFRVAYICPISDIADLCDHIRLPYAISCVSMKIENMRRKLSEAGEFEVSKNNTCM